MLRSKLIICCAVALGLIGGRGARAHSPTVVIQMTAEGFAPREVTVDTETIVNFVNKDTVDRWPASNVHPTHDIYPEFDPKRPIPPGDFWIFRPKRTGEFKYHDHLRPHKRGTITVVPEENLAAPDRAAPTPAADKLAAPPPSVLSRWQARVETSLARALELIRRLFRRNSTAIRQPADQPTAEVIDTAAFSALTEQEQYRHLDSLAEQHGLTATWDYVKNSYTDKTGAALGGRAHDLAHFTGELIFKDRGLVGLALCDTTFAFGCYHGFTEAAFAENLDALREVARACETLGGINTGPWASCIHGIGHGVATFFDAVELDDALATCDRLTAGATYCHDGVFMEFSFSAPPSFYASTNPLAPCTTIESRYQQACARNQPHVMQQRFTMSRAEVASRCATASPAIADPCIDALGFAIANESGGNGAAITAGCRELTGELLQAKCTAAAAGELVFQNYPNWQTAAPAVCQSLAPAYQASCHQRVEATAQNYSRTPSR